MENNTNNNQLDTDTINDQLDTDTTNDQLDTDTGTPDIIFRNNTAKNINKDMEILVGIAREAFMEAVEIVQNDLSLKSGKSNNTSFADTLIEQEIVNINSTVPDSLVYNKPTKRKRSEEGNYTVQKGDTLWKLAKKFNTTVDELARLNNIDDANRGNIYAGERLWVPVAIPAKPTASEKSSSYDNNLQPIARDKTYVDIPEKKPSYIYGTGKPVKYIASKSKSRIQYDGNGRFSVNLNNLNEVTRNNHYAAAQNPNNWTYNNETGQRDLGISTKVGEIQLKYRPITTDPDYTPPNMDNTLGAPNPAYNPASVTIVAENAKSTGKPDRRVKPRTINTGSAAATRGGAGFMLALNAFFVAYDLWSAYAVNQDLDAITREKDLLEITLDVIEQCIDIGGIIPQQYQNINDIGAIVNFVFQGINDTGDQNITKIGTDILKTIRRYDTKTQTIKPIIEE